MREARSLPPPPEAPPRPPCSLPVSDPDMLFLLPLLPDFKSLLPLLLRCEKIRRPEKGQRRRFMTGDDKRADLIT